MDSEIVKYWQDFYKKCDVTSIPSDFARFCSGFFKRGSTIADVGCGNCRDTFYFASLGHKVIGIDAVDCVAGEIIPTDTVTLIKTDIEQLRPSSYDNIYARFLLHAIPEETEDHLLKWAADSLNGGYFCIECRSVLDDSVQTRRHYLRKIDEQALTDKLESLGFTIILTCRGRGFSATPAEDPVLIRVICKKGRDNE